ncbi:hypothetical protein SH2C18_31210 [Clostridium sediminicola]|uniref:hypothetical protein n=1 Tax=Clostridium sediminicola TaxID=3114879 RepID=UPI0031F1D9FF
MIKIDDNKFDWKCIDEIYNDSKDNDFVNNLAHKINKEHAEKKTMNVLIDLLEGWFFENGMVSKKKIISYLKQTDIHSIIVQYYEVLTKYLPIKDKAFYELEMNLEIVKDRAKDSSNCSERKNILLNAINPNNIHLLQNITNDDLMEKPKRGTIYSNKKKINKIKIDSTLPYFKIRNEVNEVFQDIFDYDNFVEKYRHKVISAFKVEVCPYCNRQYISNMNSKKGLKTTADLDHYYSEVHFPFLKLSIYNFIPSCQICNSRFKLAKNFWMEKHVYPFESGFDEDAIFTFDNIDHLFNREPSFSICNLCKKEEIDNSIKTFHIQEIYQSHNEYVKNLVEKVLVYNKSQIEEYLRELPEMFKTEEEILRFVFGNYFDEVELGKIPLGKLTKDLLSDMKIKFR